MSSATAPSRALNASSNNNFISIGELAAIEATEWAYVRGPREAFRRFGLNFRNDSCEVNRKLGWMKGAAGRQIGRASLVARLEENTSRATSGS